MAIKRFAFLLIAVVLLFSACSENGEIKNIDPQTAAETLLNEVSFRDTLLQADASSIDLNYKMDDSVEHYAIYMSSSGATAEEIAVIKVSDKANLKNAEDILKKRVEELKFRFEDYVPGEMVKLNAPVIISKGDTAVLVIADDASAAKKAVENLF